MKRPARICRRWPASWPPAFGEYLRAQADRGRPLFGPYVAKGWAAWLTWAVDAMLTLAAAVAVTIPAFRVPYCNRCRSWYRTVRNGKIDVPTARRLAETCGVDEIAGLHSPRYRLSCCQGGCGPTRCELSWEEPDGAVDLVRVWLDAEQRNQVAAILDELADERCEMMNDHPCPTSLASAPTSRNACGSRG